MKIVSIVLLAALVVVASAMSKLVVAIGHLAQERGASIHAAMNPGETDEVSGDDATDSGR